MAEPFDAVIIGGGISGLACARRLCDAKAGFLLVTDHLGGRMYHSDDSTMNFGATYVNADYRRVAPYIDRQIPLRLHDLQFQQDDRVTTLFDWRNVVLCRPMLRVIGRLQKLRHALEAFRKEALRVPQDQLRRKHPLIDRYSRQPAEELIDELGMQAIDQRYAGPTFRSTGFATPSEATALFYLASLLPMIVRTWVADFSRTYQRLTAGYQERIVLDRVVGVNRRQDRLEVHTHQGAVFPARNVVIAAPYPDATMFYPVPQPHRVTSATMLFVRGVRRRPYRGKHLTVFPPPATIASVWNQGYAWDQVYALCPEPALAEVYETSEVLRTVFWKTAIVLSDAHWAPLELEPGVFLASDYNVCGLEDTYINGVCAANQILGRAATVALRRNRAQSASVATPRPSKTRAAGSGTPTESCNVCPLPAVPRIA
jgi:glycine/D-amino acid oxidase-like deaminating enzyme